MIEADRPDPDELLARTKREEAAGSRGKLKIFFGMCPGVGKTYAMLQAAREKLAQGVEVVAGVVETHGRAETIELLEGMPVAPRLEIPYRGTTLEEMDLDAMLAWHPPLVLVDELAHTNAPGSRHPKRYQDVFELLEAGIDVYTTLNVQHVESRKDIVHQITGVAIRETVPDSMLDVADELVLVDLTPEQLQRRLADGKVYLGERAAAAVSNFFRESNLTALREMALRLVAEHVDRDLRDIMRKQKIAGPWKSGDRLLVAVGGSPFSEKLIRYTRRLASSMEASWIVANIETPRALPEAEQTQVTHHLNLARQLGAEVISVAGHDVGEALLRIAQHHNVTQIVMGKPHGGRLVRWLTRRSPVDWLIRESGEIDIHMIRSDDERGFPRVALEQRLMGIRWREYGLATAIATIVTLLSLAVLDLTGYWAISLFYLFAVMLGATRLRRGPTLLLAALSAALWNFLFIPPRFTWRIHELHDLMMFASYFILAVVIGQLTARLREREQTERKREARATALYRLTRALASSRDLDDALQSVLRLIKEVFEAEAAVWLLDPNGLTLHPASQLAWSSKSESVAAWAFQKKQSAGRFTETLPDAESLHLPLVASGSAEGIIALRLQEQPTFEQRELLEAFAAQLAVFVNKERALQQSRDARLARKSEELQKTLFDSVSHELKTPLAAMSAALDQPQPDSSELKQAVRRLTRTVDHLLDATRLESGMLQPVKEWCEPGDVLQEAIALASVENRKMQIEIEPELPEILIDPALIEQALVTLVSNAASYSPVKYSIEVSATRQESTIVFSVSDRGSGLAAGEETKVFEKFYRGVGRKAGGLGLGLSIAQKLVEVHGGKIVAQNRPGGGSHFSIRLPLGEPMKLPQEAAV